MVAPESRNFGVPDQWWTLAAYRELLQETQPYVAAAILDAKERGKSGIIHEDLLKRILQVLSKEDPGQELLEEKRELERQLAWLQTDQQHHG